MKYAQVFTFLTIILFSAGCNGQDKKGLTKEKEHPKLIITGGNRNTHVQCGLQDKAGNKIDLYRNSHWVFNIMQAKNGKLWFATIDGVYIYDGKSFTPFIVNEGAGGYCNSNNLKGCHVLRKYEKAMSETNSIFPDACNFTGCIISEFGADLRIPITNGLFRL